MDPNSLLNQNIPFDNQKLQLLENIINVFYTTKNNNDRTQADKLLNQFKVLPDSWTHCATILSNSNNNYTKFFALGILEDLIISRWNTIQQDSKNGIKNFLVELLVKNVTDDNTFVANQTLIQKLNVSIVQIAKYEWTTTWTTFMSEICNSSKSNPNLCENNLKLLQMLSEEISMFWKNSMTSNKMHELKSMMEKEFSSVYELCLFIFGIFETQKDVKKSLLKAAIRVYADYIKWFPVEFTFREDILLKFINFSKEFPAARLEVMKCFGEIFSISFESYRNNSNMDGYIKVKTMTSQLFNAYIEQMKQTTNNANLAEEYERIKMDQRSNFEEFCLQFALSIMSYFKNNFSFIEEYDFISGTQEPNQYTITYIGDLIVSLNYLCQINMIPNDEIFKNCIEFWNWLCFKVCFIREKEANPDDGIPISVYENSLNNYVTFAHDTFYYKNLYEKILDNVRQILITKMTKPIEIKMELDESGELSNEVISGTINQSLNESMRDSLIYLTHLDPIQTEKFLIETLKSQMDERNWNPHLLNSLSWSIGSITGALDESHEKGFVVLVIKYLLNLCEQKKGKTNKAIVASNIMYVVGQYPRFLNSHWKFLKTVIKKLFEFMHETHPGVQDFACETFLKIAIKCGEETVKINEGENEPYINSLVRTIKEDTNDLQVHQKLMFYEALGIMISKDPDTKKQGYYVQQMMQPSYNDWYQIFENASTNPDILQNSLAIKSLDLTLKLNERVSVAVGTSYFSFAIHILENVLKAYVYYSSGVNNAYNNKSENLPVIKLFRVIKKTILKYLQSLVKSIDDKDIILNQILPQLAILIEQYRFAHIENRDADVLLVFAEVLNKIKNSQYEYIKNIWNYLCLFTLEMIKMDFQSYPEHRTNFFKLVKSLIFNAFDALFQIQESNFNNDVITAIVWAFRHDQPEMAETGLETLLALIRNIKQIKISNGINVADPFFKNFFTNISDEILCVLTDSFHKSGFNYQVEIFNELILIVETGIISENLFNSNMSNKQFVINYLNQNLSTAFEHLNKIQVESLVLSFFNKCYDKTAFKIVVRDLLVSLKTFSGDNDALFEEERKLQLEEAKAIEEKKRSCVPGMLPVYDPNTFKNINISSSTYTNNAFN